MANKKSSIKKISVIKRNTLINKHYYSNVKTFFKKLFLALEKYTDEPNILNLKKILEYFSFIQSKMDKAKKVNVLSKNKVAKKKSSLSFIIKYFISIKKYKNEPNLLNLTNTLQNLTGIYIKIEKQFFN